MNTTQLLKAQANGMEIRVGDGCGNVGGKVEYSPRDKGDRQPWVYVGPEGVGRYKANECWAFTPVAEAPQESVTEPVTVAASGGFTVQTCGCYANWAPSSHRRSCPVNVVETRITELDRILKVQRRQLNKARKAVSA